MINQEKVRRMTNAAMFDSGSRKSDLNIAKYRRADYMTVQLFLSFLAGSCCYAALMILILIAGWNYFDSTLASNGFRSMIRILMIGYIAFMIIYMVLTAMIASRKYERSHKITKEYLEALDRIHEAEIPAESPRAFAEEQEERTDGSAT